MEKFLHLIIFAVLAACAIGGLAALVVYAKNQARKGLIVACNEGARGTFAGPKTYIADAAIADRYRIVTAGAADGSVAVCGVSDVPKGIALDNPAAAGDGVAVDRFGSGAAEGIGVASGAIARKDILVPGAAGSIRKLPAASGTYWAIGQAEEAAADTAQVIYHKWSPTQITVA